MFNWINNPNIWLELATLTFLEIILAVDNILFLSLVIVNLPITQRNKAYRLGLLGAMITRFGLLVSIVLINKHINPVFNLFKYPISLHNLIMFFGGLFLIWKSYKEILTLFNQKNNINNIVYSYIGAIIQIITLDIILSLDSIITAIGLSSHIFVMLIALLISVILMILAAKIINNFINKNKSIKILALLFLALIGFMLVLESFSINISKGYIYFTMCFSLLVEILNFLYKKNI